MANAFKKMLSCVRLGSSRTDDMTENNILTATVDAFIRTTNASNIKAALALFTPKAVIDDPSVGDRFVGHVGMWASKTI